MKCFSGFVIAVLAFGTLLLAPTIGNAGLITGVSSSNTTAVAASFVSSTFNGAAGPLTNGGSVTIDLDVKQLHVPVVLTFTIAAGGVDSGGVLRDTSSSFTNYTLTLNVKNSIPASAGIDQLNFKGFDLTTELIGQGAQQLLGSVKPTSNVFAVEYKGTRNISGGFRWGGLAGGGATLAAGSTAVNTVVWSISYDNQAATTAGLNFTANPEPATLLLGSLVLAPAAWVVRRRRKAAAELESAPV